MYVCVYTAAAILPCRYIGICVQVNSVSVGRESERASGERMKEEELGAIKSEPP